MAEVKWVLCTDDMPSTAVEGRKEYLATVICDTWKEPKTMCVSWENTTIRGKFVSRWLRRGRIFPCYWKIVAWADMPEPCVLTAD